MSRPDTGALALLSAIALVGCPGRVPVLNGRVRVELAHPLQRSRSLFDVHLAAEEQIEWRAPACEAREATTGDWFETLQAERWIVETGSWQLEGHWGIRFRRGEMYGDLYSVITFGPKRTICHNYVLRLQRGLNGKPILWQTRYSLWRRGDPSFYFDVDPLFPTDSDPGQPDTLKPWEPPPEPPVWRNSN